MQMRLLWWENGVKLEIAAQVKVDPLTYKDKAQSAACALGSHIDASSSAAAERRQSSPNLACAAVKAPPAQRQSVHPSKPTGLLQFLDVLPIAWHTVTTDYITCCQPHT